jgi:outer membrane protein assembly factor BamB
VSREPQRSTAALPGGIRVRSVWGGSGDGAAVFALSEVGAVTTDLGELAGPDPDALGRAEIRVETPSGPWAVRLASRVGGEPATFAWDAATELVVAYGFLAYAFDARSGHLRWTLRSGTPIVAVLGSPRLGHVLVQSEVETFAVAADGEVVWRVAHSDVVTAAALVGGRLVLTGYGGEAAALDPATGRTSA